MKKVLIISSIIGSLTVSMADMFSFFDKSPTEKAQKAYSENRYADALKLYKQACDERKLGACNEIGFMYEYGAGMTPDYEKAKYYYSLACNQGATIACENLNTLNEKLDKVHFEKDRLPKYEKDYLAEFENLKKTYPQPNFKYIQPSNKKEVCKIAVPDGQDDPTKDPSYKIFWDGDCKDGYAFGLGREIEKANMKDSWQLGIYEKGMANGYLIQKDLLDGFLAEGEANYYGSSYIVRRYIDETNGDIDVSYVIGKDSLPFEPDLVQRTSPFWNNTFEYHKRYPNFGYLYVDLHNNDLNPIDFNFQLVNDKGERHGWGYEKNKNGPLVKGEYINGKPQQLDLPDEYMRKSETIINEIEEAKNKALDAQKNARLVKKQYLKKICRDSVKVTFMDNSEYKEICEEKDELVLQAKIDNKLANIQRERTAMIQKQQQEQARQKEDEQIRQQQAYQQQQLNLQRRQLEEQEHQNSISNFNQAMQNLSNSMKPTYTAPSYDALDMINAQKQNKQNKQMNYQLQQINNNLNGIRYGY